MDITSDDDRSNPKGGTPLDLSKSQQESDLLLVAELEEHIPATCGARQLSKLKRFLTTLQRRALDDSSQMADKVWHSTWALANGLISSEQFYHELHHRENFPLKPFMIEFLKANLPYLQRELFFHKYGMQTRVEETSNPSELWTTQNRFGFNNFTQQQAFEPESMITDKIQIQRWQIPSAAESSTWVCDYENRKRSAEYSQEKAAPFGTLATVIHSQLEKVISSQKSMLENLERLLTESKQEIMSLCPDNSERQSAKSLKKLSKSLGVYKNKLESAEQEFKNGLQELQPVTSSFERALSAILGNDRALRKKSKADSS